MIKKVFIDGEEGTTGLQIYERLEKHPNIEVIKIHPSKRKDLSEKKEMMKKARGHMIPYSSCFTPYLDDIEKFIESKI